jgi:hypothetical protein
MQKKFGGFIPDYLVGSKLLLNFAALTKFAWISDN